MYPMLIKNLFEIHYTSHSSVSYSYICMYVYINYGIYSCTKYMTVMHMHASSIVLLLTLFLMPLAI